MILCLKTDSEIAEIYLYSVDNYKPKNIDKISWRAHRQLANQLLPKIEEFLAKNDIKFTDLGGIVVFTGSGSFTGLRIGATVANTLAYALNIKVVNALGQDWQVNGINRLKNVKLKQYSVPKYSAAPNITKPKA